MIVINDIKDIEKYKIGEVPSKDNLYVKSLIYYEFKSDSELQDVEFNIRVPFSPLDLISKTKEFEIDDIDPFDVKYEITPIDYYIFIAKNVRMNKGGGLYSLQADSLLFNGNCDIEILNIKNNIIGDKLNTEKLYSKQVKCKDVEIKNDIACENIKSNNLSLGKFYLQNVDCKVNMP